MLSRLRQLLRPPAPAAPAVPRKAPFGTVSPLMLEQAGASHTAIVRRKLEMPELPPGVRPKGGKSPVLAMDDAGQGAWNWGSGVGVAGAFGCGLYFPGYQYLAELSQRSEYREPVATLADEMTRRWIKFVTDETGKKSKRLTEIKQRMEDLNVQALFRQCEINDGLFGRSQLYVDIKGQQDDLSTPLLYTPETIKKGSLLGFKVIEPMWTTPITWNANDPTREDFYKPTHWYVMGRDTHATRLLTFVSRPLPDLLKPAYNFGGLSLVQLMEPYVNQWLRTRDAVSDLIYNYSILILSCDLSQLTEGGGDASALYNRIQFFLQTRNNKGMMALDKDSEEMTQIAVPLAGLHELQSQSQEHMCAPSHMPLVKLTGVTPSGLNASSDGEIQVWYDYIKARQVTCFGAHLKTVIDLVQLDLYGKVDDSITSEWEPLTEPDGEAEGRIRKADAERAQVYISAGVISREEERERIARDPNSGYDNLNLAELPPDPLEQQLELANATGGNDDEPAEAA